MQALQLKNTPYAVGSVEDFIELMEDEVRRFCDGPDEQHFLKILRGLPHHSIIAELAGQRDPQSARP